MVALMHHDQRFLASKILIQIIPKKCTLRIHLVVNMSDCTMYVCEDIFLSLITVFLSIFKFIERTGSTEVCQDSSIS